MGTAGHRCEACGYVIDGLPEPRCPKCGTAFDPDLLRLPVRPLPPLPWPTFAFAVAGTALVLAPFWLARILGGSPTWLRVAILPYAIGLGLNAWALWRAGRAFRVRQWDLAWWLLALACFVACVGLTCGGLCGAFSIVLGGLEFGAP